MTGRSLKVNLVANTSQFKSAMSETSNQMKLINSEFKSAAAETDKYGNQLDKTGAKKKQLNGTIQQYTQRIKAIKQEQKHWTAELKKGNITETEHAQKQRELATRLNSTEAQMKKYEGQLKKMNAEGKKTTRTYADFDKQFRKVGTTMRNVGAQVGITAGVGFMAMKRVLSDVVKEASSFHAQMSEVQAISGATGDEIAKLTKQSKDLGKATKFTSQQAAESQANLARAGFTVNEIYDTMPGLLDLAASSNLELGTAANATANIIRTFNFEAKESGRVADVLAKGAATANQDVQGLAKAMEIAGPVANSLNLSFESVAAATGIMADAGVDGSTAGRMLRQGMLRLAKPTGEAGKLLKKMGLEAFDADGNMKSLDKVVAELEKGLKGQTKQQKAAALATIFGSESTAGWTVLLDKGADELEAYTKELENSEGAAKAMADVMQDNAEGAIIRMQSALSGLKIELGEKLLPILAKGADYIGDLANKFSEMDEETITTIAHTALLVTAVLGVTTVVAGLVAGLGAFMMVAGPIGLAVAAGTLLLGGLAAAVYKNKLETENSNKVNLDNAKSLSEQAFELEKSANTFDKLSDKAKISNSELAQLNDLNERIAKGGSSDEIAKLQAQYDKLAKKSGLSKDELQKLFDANADIIKQSPNVEQSVSEQGNAFAENTKKVREYLDTLDEMSQNELTNERTVALEREREIIKEITKQKKEQKQLDEELGLYEEAKNMSATERKTRIEEINGLYRDQTISEEAKVKLNEEQVRLLNLQSGHYQEATLEIRDQMKEKAKSIEKSEEELAKIAQIDTELANIKLRRLGINEEGEKGLVVLEKKLAKNHETLSNLDVQNEKNGKLTDKQQEQYDKLSAQNEKLEEAQSYINGELELYGSVNSLVESQSHLLSKGTQEKVKSLEKTLGIKVAEGDILKQIQEKNGKLVEERVQLEKNRKAQGANKEEIDKQIAAIEKKINAGDGVALQMLKELDLLDLVKNGITLNGTELQAYLEGLGYTTEEAFSLAQQLSGETVKALKEGTEESKKAGKEKGDAHKDGVDSTKEENKKSGKEVSDGTTKELNRNNEESKQGGKKKGDAHKDGLDSTKNANEKSGKEVSDGTNKGLDKNKSEAEKAGKNKGIVYHTGLDGTKKATFSAASFLSLGVTGALAKTTDGGGGKKAGGQFNTGVASFKGAVSRTAISVATSGKSGLASVKTSSTGTDFVSGFRGSINSGNRSVWNTAWSLGKSALSALKKSIKSASPSKETGELGIDFTDGFSLAIDKGKKKSIKSAMMVGKETTQSLSDEINKYKQSFGAIALAVEGNKQTLKVEHTLDKKFDEFASMFRAFNSNNDNDQSFGKLLNAMLQQNQLLMKLLEKDNNVYLGAKRLAREITPEINRIQGDMIKDHEIYNG